MRNEEYEKALKSAQVEISNARKLANQLDQIQKLHEEDSKKFLDLQRETQNIGLFRETINKQEEVIKKLETLLSKTVNESKKQKESLLELEQLRTENLKLQRELKDIVINTNPGVIGKTNPVIENYKKEIKKLENQVRSLQEELNSKRPISSNKKDMQNNIVDLEVQLHKSQSR